MKVWLAKKIPAKVHPAAASSHGPARPNMVLDLSRRVERAGGVVGPTAAEA
jgi:hypothetical protein